MKIDYLAALGAFAFRNVPNSDVQGVLRLLDREALDMALVSALEAVMYRNVQAGNELLAARVRDHPDRLLAAAVVNPVYPQAAEDARICLAELGMKAIRLYPSYHGYDLGSSLEAPGFQAVMHLAAEHRVPVSVAFQVEDPRQDHVLVRPVPVEAADVAQMICTFPEVNFVLERVGLGSFRTVLGKATGATNWFVETSSRFLTVQPRGNTDYPHRGHPDLIKQLGAERVLLGTDLPLQYPRATLMKLEALDLAPEQRRMLMGENAARLLGLS